MAVVFAGDAPAARRAGRAQVPPPASAATTRRSSSASCARGAPRPKIRSEHVVAVLDVGVARGGAPYMVMEYLERARPRGAPRASAARSRSTTAVDYVLQACEAIAEAHALGIVHRDLKPANLFLTHRADGSPCVKVLDFGISKATVPTIGRRPGRDLTATAMVMGSPHYMSPEQMRRRSDVDARSDIWALGAILTSSSRGGPFDGER